MHFDDALGNSESESRPTFLASNRIVGLLKLLEQLGLIGGGDTGAGVLRAGGGECESEYADGGGAGCGEWREESERFVSLYALVGIPSDLSSRA